MRSLLVLLLVLVAACDDSGARDAHDTQADDSETRAEVETVAEVGPDVEVRAETEVAAETIEEVEVETIEEVEVETIEEVEVETIEEVEVETIEEAEVETIEEAEVETIEEVEVETIEEVEVETIEEVEVETIEEVEVETIEEVEVDTIEEVDPEVLADADPGDVNDEVDAIAEVEVETIAEVEVETIAEVEVETIEEVEVHEEVAPTCDPGTYLAGTTCAPCAAVTSCIGAVTCTDASDAACDACAAGTYLNDGRCVACSPLASCSATTCTSAADARCVDCDDGTYLSGGRCLTCSTVPSCTGNVTCNTASDSRCDACAPGSYLVNGRCAACPSVPSCVGDVTCTSANDVQCDECAAGSYLSNGRCNACNAVPSCIGNVTCTSAGNSACDACTSGTYLSNGQCVPCNGVDNCTSSLTCSNASDAQCTSCAAGTYLDNGRCTSCTSVGGCTSPLSCSNSGDSQCSSCATGMYLEGGRCVACSAVGGCVGGLTCTNATDSQCGTCGQGTFRDNGQCTTCSPVQDCAGGLTCTGASDSQCGTCLTGNYLDNGACLDCTPVPECTGALTCTSATDSQCGTCAPGNYVEAGQCVDCQPVPGCTSAVTCTGAGDSQCTSCGDGYYLDDGACLACTDIEHCAAGLTCVGPGASTCAQCDIGHAGPDCTVACEVTCNNGGLCEGSTCDCAGTGYGGSDCSVDVDECLGATTSPLIITGVFDGPLTGGQPKVVEITVLSDVFDLSRFGVGAATNGLGTNGIEYTFPNQPAGVGDVIYLTSNLADFQVYFGFAANAVGGQATNINGDDAIELFMDEVVVDRYGDPNVDGSATPWDYVDGWAARKPGAAPTPTFDIADWTLSGIDATDGCTSDATCLSHFPSATYGLPETVCGEGLCHNSDGDYRCECPDGRYDDGVTCSLCAVIDHCAVVECGNAEDATCVQCNAGYLPDGDGGCFGDPCATAPCTGLDETCVPDPLEVTGRRCDGPFDDLEGYVEATLRGALLDRIDGHVPLGYSAPGEAREHLFAVVEVFDGRLECVYTGRTMAAEDPDASPVGDTLPKIDTTPNRDCRYANGTLLDPIFPDQGCAFNTEHSWPQSLGAEFEPMRSDMHHLFPSEENVNSQRGNHAYGNVIYCPNNNPNCLNAEGGSIFGYINELRRLEDAVFQVRLKYRGDIARAQFYFSVRYSMAIPPTVEATLRVWNDEDPPDEHERTRHERIRILQNNRNPFVDRPDFVDAISDF